MPRFFLVRSLRLWPRSCAAWGQGLILFAVLGAAGRADVELASVFGDHAVIQRDQPVAVWGTAEAGEHIVVAFHGVPVNTTAGSDGRWTAMIGPYVADADGAELLVQGKNVIRLSDVVVGDVWLCSGQSNMELALASALDSKKEIATGAFPLVRQIRLKHKFSPVPQAKAPTTGWQAATPGTVGDFSAVAYFFAREMHRRSGVPIGIVQSTSGGTPIEAWISAEALARDPAYPAVAERQKCATTLPFAERKASYDAACAEWEKDERAATAAGASAHESFLKQHAKPE